MYLDWLHLSNPRYLVVYIQDVYRIHVKVDKVIGIANRRVAICPIFCVLKVGRIMVMITI